MKQFETTEDQLKRYFKRGLMFIVGVLSFMLWLQIEILKQQHEMERANNKKYLNK